MAVARLETVNRIVLHQSASSYGTSTVIDGWHRERGWSGIGYHRVILNGHRASGSPYEPEIDGLIQDGRSLAYQGAHVEGWNGHTLGVCLIGEGKALPVGLGYISENMWQSLVHLCLRWHREYGVPFTHFVGHREFPGVTKTCPGFEVAELRAALAIEAAKQIKA